MKNLLWKLVFPLTIISFASITKWWFVLPVDAPDTMMTGFPLPYVCPGWHTSMSLQIFMVELVIDLVVYFSFWLACVYGINRYLMQLRIHWLLATLNLSIAGVIILAAVFIGSMENNLYFIKRPFDIEVLDTGYRFIWQNQKRPDYSDYVKDNSYTR